MKTIFTIQNESGLFWNGNTNCWGPECAASTYTVGELPRCIGSYTLAQYGDDLPCYEGDGSDFALLVRV